MNDEKTRQIFEKIGLSEYESRAYIALVSNGSLTASEVSSLANVPRGRVYDVLERLGQRSFCVMVHGSVRKYSPCDPNKAIEAAVAKRDCEWRDIRSEAFELASSLAETFNVTTISEPEDFEIFLTVLSSEKNIIQKFKALVLDAKEGIRLFSKQPFVTPFTTDYAEANSDPFRTAAKAGIPIKALYEVRPEYETDRELYSVLQYYEALGEEVRIATQLPTKMLVIDRSTIMFSAMNSKKKLESTVISHAGVIEAMIVVFEQHWLNATPLAEHLEQLQKKYPEFSLVERD